MEDLRRTAIAVIVLVVAVLVTLSLIFIHEFSSPDGAFRKAIGECGDGFCQAFETDNCPEDCGVQAGSETANAFLVRQRSLPLRLS